MGNFAKWIGGGVGWALGGPIGAIIGFALGSMFGNTQVRQTAYSNRRTTEADFKASLLVMIACVLKADGRVMKAELDVVKKFLLHNFGEESSREALQILKKLIDQPINVVEVANQIKMYMNDSAKLQLVRFLFDIAYADGVVNEAELTEIRRIAYIFGMSSIEFESLKAPYVKHTDVDWAFKALEIDKTATVDEIKKAYRRMAMKFHPDKVHNLGEEVKKSATEKFRAINEAYEHLKKVRNFI